MTPEEHRIAWRRLAWATVVWILVAFFIFAIASVTTGCAASPSTLNREAGPREVASVISQPTCAFLCWLTVTITDSEGAKVEGAASVAITKPISTSTSVTTELPKPQEAKK
jgi:hypothetical protein